MQKYPTQLLSLFRKNQKFEWSGKVYTVFEQESNMTEVFDGVRFWAWPNWTKVIPITLE